MFSALAHGDANSHVDFVLESDIVDECHAANIDHDLSFNHDIPSRPTSRLSFNRATIDSPPLSEEEISELYPESCLDDHTSSLSYPQLLQQLDLADPDTNAPALNQQRPDNSGTDVESDSDSSYTDSDDESPPLPSSLEFPSTPVHTFFSPPLQASDWTLRPKFSCLPSPLSPRYTRTNSYTFRHTPARHRYFQHGHSRHALHHLKWFWATREDKWLECRARLYESKAYDGLSIFNDIPSELRLPGGCASPEPTDVIHPVGVQKTLPPMTIHPRRGDIHALRDPYCMHIDRYFVGMPLWTMAKTLWMFDIHLLSGGTVRTKHTMPKDGLAEEALVETLDPAEFSDDSDSTLVESDSEGDLSGCEDGPGDQTLDGDVECSDSLVGRKDPLASYLDPEPSYLSHKAKSNISLLDGLTSRASLQSTHAADLRSNWATSWYRRWEILMHLCDKGKSVGSAVGDPSSGAISRSNFTADESWSEILLADDGDSSDEEDMKKVQSVANPLRVGSANALTLLDDWL